MNSVLQNIVAKLTCALLILIPATGFSQDAISDAALEHTKELLMSTPLIDGHNDLPWLIREETGGDVVAFGLERENTFDTDIPRLRKGLLGAQFWSVWIPGETAAASAMREFHDLGVRYRR